jgi:hypothetical protein
MKKPPITREDRIAFIVQNIDKLILKSFQGGAYSRSISDYSLGKLNAMTDDELEMIFMKFDEFQEYYREEGEKRLFFNQPFCSADNSFWCKQPFWTIDEGICLVLGRDPRKVTWDSIRSHTKSSFYHEFRTFLKMH